MLLIHVALPLQSIYSFVKRHNKGAWLKRYDYWALMFLGRVVVQLQPTIVCGFFFVLFACMRACVQSCTK